MFITFVIFRKSKYKKPPAIITIDVKIFGLMKPVKKMLNDFIATLITRQDTMGKTKNLVKLSLSGTSFLIAVKFKNNAKE